MAMFSYYADHSISEGSIGETFVGQFNMPVNTVSGYITVNSADTATAELKIKIGGFTYTVPILDLSVDDRIPFVFPMSDAGSFPLYYAVDVTGSAGTYFFAIGV